MGYIYPTATTAVSDSFADHVARGSVNPGTDYKAPYGSPVYAVAAGRVNALSSSNRGSGGRLVNVGHLDGTGADYLHLSRIVVGLYANVTQGQLIGYSGASGNGSDWGYGPHLHLSFRPNHSTLFANYGNRDFDALMSAQSAAAGGDARPLTSPPLTTNGDEMIRIQSPARGIALIGPGYYRHLNTDEEVQNSGPLITAHVNGNDRQFDLWVAMAFQGNSSKP
jgi:murein DD-endopeptidase MepM/ murein hydrolase activator NlpD